MLEVAKLTAEDYARSSALLAERGMKRASIVCAQRAVSLSPGDARIQFVCANAFFVDSQFAIARQFAERAIRIQHEYPEAWHLLGIIKSCEGTPWWRPADTAFSSAISQYAYRFKTLTDDDLTDKTKAEIATVHVDRALMLLSRGEYTRGFEEYEWRRTKHANVYPTFDLPEPTLSDKEATVYCYAEQGIGDIVMFSRYLPLLAERVKKVVFGVQPSLLSLFNVDFADETGVEVDIHGDRLPAFKHKINRVIPLASLPKLFNTTFDSIPPDPGYIRQEADKVAKYANFPQPHTLNDQQRVYKIGICWSGNPEHGHDYTRTVALERFLFLANTPQVQLYSFQVGRRANDITLAGAQPLVFDLQPALTSWLQTAAHLTFLDAFISVDTGVAHLAAALGIPTWLLISNPPEWRWGIRDLGASRTPWYPSVRLFRQVEPGDWDQVLNDVYNAMNAAIYAKSFADPRLYP